jgi:two-component sensor histidine kinase
MIKGADPGKIVQRLDTKRGRRHAIAQAHDEYLQEREEDEAEEAALNEQARLDAESFYTYMVESDYLYWDSRDDPFEDRSYDYEPYYRAREY